MMKSTLNFSLIVLGYVTLFTLSSARAVVIAEDDASEAAYADGWTLGDNGGTGFMPWSGAGNYGGGPMDIDVGPDATNNLGTPAFRTGPGLTGFQVSRQFQNPLQVGQSFTMDFDNYPLAPSGGDILIAFNAQDGVGGGDKDERLSMYAYYYNDGFVEFGNDNWGINAQSANNNLAGGAGLPPGSVGGIAFQTPYTTTDSSDGFALTFDLLTVDTYRLRVFDDAVTKLDITGQLYNQTVGELINEVSIYGSPVSDLTFEQMVYFNNMKIQSAAGQPGDFDNDGDVDGRDFLVWQRTPSVGALADWQNNYGFPGLAAFSSVPEPTSITLCGLILLSSLALRGSRRCC